MFAILTKVIAMSFSQIVEVAGREFDGLAPHQVRHAVNRGIATPQKVSGRFVYSDSDVQAVRGYLDSTSLGWRQRQEAKRRERLDGGN